MMRMPWYENKPVKLFFFFIKLIDTHDWCVCVCETHEPPVADWLMEQITSDWIIQIDTRPRKTKFRRRNKLNSRRQIHENLSIAVPTPASHVIRLFRNCNSKAYPFDWTNEPAPAQTRRTYAATMCSYSQAKQIISRINDCHQQSLESVNQ